MLTAIADDVLYDRGPVQFLGLELPATMTVVRLEGGLLLHSPLALTPERLAEVTRLGEVAHLYAPNTFHHRWLGEWMQAFPAARVHAPSELTTKRPDLRIDRFHDRELSGIEGLVEVPIRGFRLRETALVVDRVAVVTDLVQNIGRPTHGWTRLYSKAMGFYDQVALSRALRWTSFDDRAAARASVDALLEHPFESLVVGRGTPIREHAHDVLAAAMAWLPR